MNISDAGFLNYLEHKEIPPAPPVSASPFGREWPSSSRVPYEKTHHFSRDQVISLGMYAIVDLAWTKDLAGWIGKRYVLEVMAGAGWLAKALRLCGVAIIATDNNSRGHKSIVPVRRMRAVTAIKRFNQADILIISWPEYSTSDAFEAIKAWGPERPIIYIGEGHGGCTASDAFHEAFRPLSDQPDIPLLAWPGIHDYVQIGHYKNGALEVPGEDA